MVILQIQGDVHWYVNFNRRIGMNLGTLEAGNMVLVHSHSAGDDFAVSTLKSKMIQGCTYDAAPLLITVNKINTSADPVYADITIGVSQAPVLNAPVSNAPVSQAPESEAPSTTVIGGCRNDKVRLIININAGNDGVDTRVVLKRQDKNKQWVKRKAIYQRGFDNNSLTTLTRCLSIWKCYSFAIKDKGRNRTDGGSYNLYLGGNLLVESFFPKGRKEVKKICPS